MIYTDETRAYLSAQKFSNAGIINLKNAMHKTLYRDEYLLGIAENKKVLHVGFVDHLPLIDEKIAQNRWLHKKLMDISAVCYGLDINKQGIEYLQEQYAYENLFALDIINDPLPEAIVNLHFDYLLIPDVIEHIGNPVMFLSHIKDKFQNSVERIIITTPNAFRWDNFTNAFKGIEVINTDHRFWFTPYTLSKIVIDAGFTINSLDFFEHGKVSNRRFFKKIAVSNFHAFRDTLVLDASIKP